MSIDIKKRFINFITDNGLIEKDDKVIVGLSGGPDSVCLLHLLNEVREEFKLKIIAVHINHMFRGKEADCDEEYARGMCERLNITFYSKRIDVAEYARKGGLSSETAGREVRYNYFKEILQKNKMNKVATAHNANDQAETILMRVMRGTGLEGLGGIPVKREGIYIRPILFMKREEVEKYCIEKDLKPRIDKTNMERIYNRNKVRLDILPYMKSNFNEDVVEAINRMAMLLQMDNQFIQKQVQKYYDEFCVEEHRTISIKKEAFLLEESIISRLIRKAINEVCGNKYDLELKHIKDIIQLQKLETSKKIDLPNGVMAINVYKNINIKSKEKIKIDENNMEELDLSIEECLHKEINFQNYVFRFEVVDKNINIKDSCLIKYFDYNKIEDDIIIRNRKDGDKIKPLGMSGSKKLKDIFIDMKIPREHRDTIPIIQFGHDIGWIVGLKISEKFKITSETAKVLKIIVNRKE